MVSPLEGTYLAWVDLRECVKDAKDVEKIVLENCKIAVDFGDWFGGERFAGFIRINLATSLENIEIAVNRLSEYFSD